MSVAYKVIPRGEPGVVGGGTPKYYALAVSKGNKNIRDISKEISRMSSLTRADVIAVLEAFVDLIPEYLGAGFAVSLGELGTLSISLKSTGSETAEEVTAANIQRHRVLFRPGREVKGLLSDLQFSKDDS